MTNNRRIVAAVMGLVLLLVMFFSEAYIVEEANHHCTGANCPICHEIQICQQILSTVGIAVVGRLAFFFASIFLAVLMHAHVCETGAITLISLKVKLSD